MYFWSILLRNTVSNLANVQHILFLRTGWKNKQQCWKINSHKRRRKNHTITCDANMAISRFKVQYLVSAPIFGNRFDRGNNFHPCQNKLTWAKTERDEVLHRNLCFCQKGFWEKKYICFTVISVVVCNQYYLVKSPSEKKFLLCKELKESTRLLQLSVALWCISFTNCKKESWEYFIYVYRILLKWCTTKKTLGEFFSLKWLHFSKIESFYCTDVK